MTDEEALRVVVRIRADAPQGSSSPVDSLLDALGEALRDDLERGAHWMNEAASKEFEKKYPRFATLFRVARKVDWSDDS